MPGFTKGVGGCVWLECGVFPGGLERVVTKGKPTRWALFLLPCTGSKMRTIKFDTIQRAFTGPPTIPGWADRMPGFKKGVEDGGLAGKVFVT